MLAAIGCLVPEALSDAGVSLGEPVWWKVGSVWGSPCGGGWGVGV